MREQTARQHIVDAAWTEEGTLLLYGSTREQEKPSVHCAGKTQLVSFDWFPGNGFIAELRQEGKKGGFSSLLYFTYPDGVTEHVRCGAGEIRLFSALGQGTGKRHRARALLLLKKQGFRAMTGALLTFLRHEKRTYASYRIPVKRNDLVPADSCRIDGFVLCRGDSAYASSAAAHILSEAARSCNAEHGYMPDVIYTDEDYLRQEDSGIIRVSPILKPDFDPWLLREPGYLDGPVFVRKDLVQACLPGAGGTAAAAPLLDAEQAHVLHVPSVLFHRTGQEKSQGNGGRSGFFTNLPALADRTDAALNETTVSILIPNKDHTEDLSRCIDSILSRSTHQHYEILVLENNSTEEETWAYYRKLEETIEQVRIICYDGAFNYSAINNLGAAEARGEYLLLLNNDTEVRTPDWIEQMLAAAETDHAGAVGAKLLYPDGTIQHAGVYIGVNGTADHLFKGFPADAEVQFDALNVVHRVSAVTGACLLIKKSLWTEAGGMNEELAVAFNDIDLCLRLQEMGYNNILTPRAVLSHFESKSRGQDIEPARWRRFRRETGYMHARWNRILTDGDPYYNRNLTRSGTDALLKRRYE